MHELWAQTKAFVLAVAVHALMAAVVVVGTMNWKPFKPPVISGMTIEAVMVDTSIIKKRREEAQQEAERAVARQAEKDRRERELKERNERLERERKEEEAAEIKRLREQVARKREEDLRIQRLREQQEKDRQALLKKQQDELAEIRRQRDEATRQRKIEEERLKQLDARKRDEAEKQRQAIAEADLQRQIAQEQAEFRAGQIASLGDKYYAAIQSQVTLNWLRPPTARTGLRCTLRIVQIVGGEVISANIVGSCIADEATRNSIKAAVLRASPLPYRGFEDAFDREIDFIFTYDDN